MSKFRPNRSFLNPKFEGYRLSPLSQDSVVQRYPLPYKPTQSTISSSRGASLSFQQVQSRITHNHLAVRDNQAIYVDAEYNVVLVHFEPSTLTPSFHIVHQLPRPIQTSASSHAIQPEYPSAVFSSNDLCFISDGHSYLHVLHIPRSPLLTASPTLIASHQLSIPSTDNYNYNSSVQNPPFLLHHVTEVNESTAVAILSSRYHPNPTENGESSTSASTLSHKKEKEQVQFDVWAVKISLFSSENEIREMHVLWHRRGGDVPVLASYDTSQKSWLLVGGSAYHSLTSTPIQQILPSDSDSNLNSSVEVTAPTSKPRPLYSWTQTADSLTLTFPLPSSTDIPTSAIKISFAPNSLSLLILPPSTNSDSEPAPPLPRYTARTLWGSIDPSTSLWTLERNDPSSSAQTESETDTALLTLHLDKKDAGTRWPQIFLSEEDGEEVAETLDPSVRSGILESMNKFTSSSTPSSLSDRPSFTANADGSFAARAGRGKTQAELEEMEMEVDAMMGGGEIPSLAKGEWDEEVDESVGRSVYLTWVSEDEDESKSESESGESVQLLSTPLPGATSLSTPELSFVIKNNLDGLLYALNTEQQWEHRATYPALSFVLASKRDTRFVHHVGSRLVLAFEGGAGPYGGNVYLYWGAKAGAIETWGKQSVLKVGGGVLGVGAIHVGSEGEGESGGEGKRTALCLCLCEGELVVLRDIL